MDTSCCSWCSSRVWLPSVSEIMSKVSQGLSLEKFWTILQPGAAIRKAV
jgi:hypothetical protein